MERRYSVASVSTQKADEMLENPEKLEKYSKASKKMAITNANERIYSVVKKVLNMV